jgi:hypothetical protein
LCQFGEGFLLLKIQELKSTNVRKVAAKLKVEQVQPRRGANQDSRRGCRVLAEQVVEVGKEATEEWRIPTAKQRKVVAERRKATVKPRKAAATQRESGANWR